MKNFLVKAFICAEAALYLAFTVMDVFDTGDSRWLKFAGIALCFVVSALLSAKGGEVLVTAAVGLSAAADILLLILDVHYAVGVMLLIGICVAMAAGWSHATAPKPYDYAKWLRTEWNGETGGMPTTLIVDTVCGDSVEARLMISKAGGLVKENLKGSLEIASEGCYVYLRNSDPQTNDSSVIRLLVAQEAVRMGGSVQTSDSTSLAMSLLRAGSKEKVKVQAGTSQPKQSKKNRKSQRTRKTDNSNGSYSSSSSTNTSSASHSVRNKPTEEAQPAASEPSQPDPSKGGFRLEVIKKE